MSKEPSILINSDGVPFDAHHHGSDHVVVTGEIKNGKTFCMNHLAEAMKGQFNDPAGTMKKTILENTAIKVAFKDEMPAAGVTKFIFDATVFVQPGHELDSGEWSEQTRGEIAKIRDFYPELSHWGDLAIGSAFGDFSRDFIEVSWAPWMLEKREELFLSYCCLIQTRGEWKFHFDEEDLIQADEWKRSILKPF